MTAKNPLVVVKVGTGVVAKNDALNDESVCVLARQVGELKWSGCEVVLVSSGAIAAGAARVQCLGGGPDKYPKRVLASIGARHLLNTWADAFALQGMEVAQVWVTYGNLRLRGERRSICTELRRLASDPRLVPVVNENDIVSAVEIRKMRKGLGDNDRLARIVACLIGATHVLFVTSKGGVFTDNPDHCSSAAPISVIGAQRRHRLPRKTSGPSPNGRGGMQSKVNQASICARRGISAGIVGVRDVFSFVAGKQVGTRVA